MLILFINHMIIIDIFLYSFIDIVVFSVECQGNSPLSGSPLNTWKIADI